MPESDPRQALNALVARLSVTPRVARPKLIRLLLPLLADVRLPLAVRIASAGRILQFIPDRALPVRRVVRAITAGLSPQKALDRLRQLQHEVEKCDSLDDLIAIRERRLKLSCPRCRVRLPRVEMIEHLWHSHGLTVERGKIRGLQRMIANLQAQHAKNGDPESLDRVVGLAGSAGLRRWLANDDTPVEELMPLVAEASERGTGLCPGCFAHLLPATNPVPPPLSLIDGRLAGDGFVIEVRGNRWFRTLSSTMPDSKMSIGRRSLTPRGAATLAAGMILLVTLALASSTSIVIAGFLLALGAYVGIRFTQTPPESRDDRLIDTAWRRVASGLIDKVGATRFLTRLCLVSLGRGNPELRAAMLNRIAARARNKSAQSKAELQLLAAVNVLQVEDEAQFGRDVIAGIAALSSEGFAGELPADYAEYVVESYSSREREPGEIARLRILLLAAAFEAGLVPRDLLDLWAGAPNLRRTMMMEPAHRLGLLFGVWRTREAQEWQSVGPAETVFDLARTSPPTAARVLAQFPDLLLFSRPEWDIEVLIGPLLICSRGLAVGGYLTADPDAAVRLTANGRELVYGRHRIELARELPAEFIQVIRRWLRFRTDSMLPFIEGYLSPGSGRSAIRVLRPFCRRCSTCGTVSAVSVGAVGRRVLS